MASRGKPTIDPSELRHQYPATIGRAWQWIAFCLSQRQRSPSSLLVSVNALIKTTAASFFEKSLCTEKGCAEAVAIKALRRRVASSGLLASPNARVLRPYALASSRRAIRCFRFTVLCNERVATSMVKTLDRMNICCRLSNTGLLRNLRNK